MSFDTQGDETFPTPLRDWVVVACILVMALGICIVCLAAFIAGLRWIVTLF